jgi:hypothetical protein
MAINGNTMLKKTTAQNKIAALRRRVRIVQGGS